MGLESKIKSLALAVSLSLSSGCGLALPIIKESKPPIHINVSRSLLFHSQKEYKDLSTEQIEKRLMELATTQKLEDAWMYNSKTKTLTEVGFKETPVSVENIHPFWYFGFENGSKKIIHYHLHTFRFPWKPPRSMPKEEVMNKINTTNGVLALPSGADIAGYFICAEWYSDVKFEGRIVDYEGILKYTMDKPYPTGLQKKLLPHSVERLNHRYGLLAIGFDDYVKKMKKLGISVEYKKLRDIEIKFNEK
ncbi:hypothetical protein ACFL0E_01115 [Nanoarchaeota archaeon]